MTKVIMLAALLCLISCKSTPKPKYIHTQNETHAVKTSIDVFATTKLESKSGSKAQGNAQFIREKDGIKILLSVQNVTPGAHGIHIHEKGDCRASDAKSAGEHYNPDKHHHGSPNPAKYHFGDLGNITIDKNGNGMFRIKLPLGYDQKNQHDWNQIIGKSLILHEKADDLKTQPSGDSGARIACGVIEAK